MIFDNLLDFLVEFAFDDLLLNNRFHIVLVLIIVNFSDSHKICELSFGCYLALLYAFLGLLKIYS